MLRLLAVFVTAMQLIWPVEVTRTVQSGLPFAPNVVVPIMNRGYLFSLRQSSPELDVFAPDGHLAFATMVTAPNGTAPFLQDAAVSETRGRGGVHRIPCRSG